VSYEPLVLPQANITLHDGATYRATLDLTAWGATRQQLLTVAPHLGQFDVSEVSIHAEEVGFRTSPQFSIGWVNTSTSRFLEVLASAGNAPLNPYRFLNLPAIGGAATQAYVVPAGQALGMNVSTKAGSCTTSAAFVQPAVGGTVLVSITPAQSFPFVGGTVYVGTSWAAADKYTVTALTGTSPYSSITLQLVEANVVAPGGTVPSGRTLIAAARMTALVHGYFRRARWPL